MPILENYRHFFDIDPDYFPAVNEAVINSKPDMWKKFFPHITFIELLQNTVNVLDRKQKLSIWVEGAYGTGKSHAVLTEKKLLEANEEDTREYFERYNLDKDLYKNLQRIKSSGKILTVHRYGSSNIHGDNDLVLAVQESIDQALSDAGINNKSKESLRQSVVRYLSDPENKQSFNIYVKGSYKDLFGGDDVDAIIDKLNAYHNASLHTLMDKIFTVSRERQIRAFTLSIKELCDWIVDVLRQNDLKAIVFIWDEFTEYFYNNSRNLTGFQTLCELSETQPFYFILVTHVSSGLFHEKDSDFNKLNDRFVRPHSLIRLPDNIAFQLMGAAMEKNKEETILADWNDVIEELADRTKNSRKIVQCVDKIRDQDMLDILPIHPYTALVLGHISLSFDSNQRSMFDFIKNDRGDEIKGFQWFIDNYGPENEDPFLTIDMLWEFFYEKGRDSLAYDVRTVLDYYNSVSKQILNPEEKRILKTILLLQAVSLGAGDYVELFIPTEKNVDLAFDGTDLESHASHVADRLVRDKILFRKQLGGGKYQYAAYMNEVNENDLKQFKENIDKKTTTALINEPLVDKTNVANAVFLEGALKLRYELCNVSSCDFKHKINMLRNQEVELEGKIVAVVCFAKDDNEFSAIYKLIRDTLAEGGYQMVFIVTTTPFGKDNYEQYLNEMANSMYQQGKNNSLASQYASNAKDILKKWKNRITSGEFLVFTEKKTDGERATNIEALRSILKTVNKEKYQRCLESEYNVLPTMFSSNYLKLGVECGVTRNTKQAFSSSSVNTKLETALDKVWNDPNYWNTYPNLLISKIKFDVDKLIRETCNSGAGRVSIRTIYDMLKAEPYGFMPCNLTAFIMGFILKEYIDGTYNWSDGLTNEVLDLNKLKEMINEIIQLQITRNTRYKDKYIVALSEFEKSFNDTTSYIFDIPLKLCSSVEQTRERIRNKMKELSFPIWTIKSVISLKEFKTDRKVLEDFVNAYCGIANSNNMVNVKTDSDIACIIGKLSRDNPYAKEELKGLLTKDNCTKGMCEYVSHFEGGKLVLLADEVGDNGQYINVLRSKFDADAANWVWNIETAEQRFEKLFKNIRL